VREPQLRADLANAGRAVASRFSWRSSAAEHLKIYESVLAGRNTALAATATAGDPSLR
jgi:glycosyltransferase involved in cell wall biosynthesis